MGGLTWTVGHAHCIPLVGMEDQLVEEACKGVIHSLKAGALWRRDESIIGVEKS